MLGARVLRAGVLGGVVAGVVTPGAADAQSVQPRPGRIEIAIGGRWIGPAPFRTTDATATAADGNRFTLFTAKHRLEPAAAVEGRVAVRLNRRIQAEGSVAAAASDFTTIIGSDVEGVPDLTAAEKVTQLTIEGAVAVHLHRSLGGAVPFISAGAGYLRHRHEGRTLVETGRTFHVGGGMDYVLSSQPGRLKAVGLRAGARAEIRTGGVALKEDATVAPSVGASLFMRF